MKNFKDTYKSLILIKNLKGLKTEDAFKKIGLLIDSSLDLRETEGLEHALKLSKELQKRQLTAELTALLHYFLGNAWSSLKRLSREDTNKVWEWEQNEIEKEIFHYRSALQSEGFQGLSKGRQCQVLTNLANSLSHIGRFVEAIEYWERALDTEPSFAMARGNRGHGLTYYANHLYDTGHQAIFLKFALNDLKSALLNQLHKNVQRAYNNRREWIESILSTEFINKKLDIFSLGDSEEEIKYRQWCLENRLFLNPLNDLGVHTIAARDVLNAPSIVVSMKEGPYYLGFFNQMKQEFVSARYQYYEGINAVKPHFSDRDVLLYNTLDYPSYSLAAEKVKVAFRMVYSLFDKIAYFINHYLGLSIPEIVVTFKTFWYTSQKKNEGLRLDFQKRKNWPLRGLFWLSKDLFEDKPGFKDSIEPEAQKLHDIRNHLEHKYLKLHDDIWTGPPSKNDKTALALTDTLAFSLYRRDFEAKTLRLIKMVRAALIYLSLAIHSEEKQRKKKRAPGSIVPKMPLGVWEDEWKV